ncbi:ureidoglycolate dehydrogenase [Photobacterium rosenbergii]|uniref:Ureidoglycolate dehydrogenase n=1 Tax=Photobacterium rosenbergii TaxID=294936 RepID=A0ABU3ZDM0_9GAMM|nr:ureidoglycolate dehydrogenase [Photobacterium rosenbergii]MDV5168209.1 ureidoglycolate dehydrogenase [Photobacterium rosenbergii]
MNLSSEQLHQLIKNKIKQAGLSDEHADIVADVLVFADARGVHSHGAVRVEYYSERISKGGINANPQFTYEETGPCSALYDGDNGAGHVIAKNAMDKAIKMANSKGVAVIGVKRMSHSGALGYFTKHAAEQGLIAISMCQSDPMVVPFGGSEVYYGTNPIAFSAPGPDGKTINFDMATTIQAWGKVLDARSRNQSIPDTWAVDSDGHPTSDPHAVRALLPIAGPKGYGLMMMVDILSGVMLGLPFGKNVSSMYDDLTEGRNLGQLHIVINPEFFTTKEYFIESISQTMKELGEIRPAPGFDKVLYPGQNSDLIEAKSRKDGIEIVDEVYDYLISEHTYINSYDHKSAFNG